MGDNRQNDNTNKRHKFLNGFLCLLAICFLNIIFGDGLRAQSSSSLRQKQRKSSRQYRLPTAIRREKYSSNMPIG